MYLFPDMYECTRALSYNWVHLVKTKSWLHLQSFFHAAFLIVAWALQRDLHLWKSMRSPSVRWSTLIFSRVSHHKGNSTKVTKPETQFVSSERMKYVVYVLTKKSCTQPYILAHWHKKTKTSRQDALSRGNTQPLHQFKYALCALKSSLPSPATPSSTPAMKTVT